MDEFLTISRRAFRRLHGGSEEDGSLPFPSPALDRLPAWAQKHRVAGLLQAGLEQAPAEMQAAAFGAARHAARWTAEAERLQERLAPQVPDIILVKGPALAAQAWPTPGLRTFDDLDWLCSKNDYPELLAGLRAAGYRPEHADSWRMEHLWQYGWGVTFHHPEGFMVEVNHRFFPPQFPWPARLDGRRRNLFRDQRLEQRCVRAPVPELHLLLCTLHAVWHGWARLAWLVDIAGLLVRHAGILPRAAALAPDAPFAARALATACGIAEAVFGPLGTETAVPAPDPAILAQARGILAGTVRAMDGAELHAFHARLMTPGEKAAFRARRLCIPGDGDFQRIRLRPAWRGLYWLLRPARALLWR